MQKMSFPFSVPDSECCVLGCGKGWENLLSPLGLVGIRQVCRENAFHFLWQRSVAALTNSVPTCLPQRLIPGLPLLLCWSLYLHGLFLSWPAGPPRNFPVPCQSTWEPG